MKTEKSIARDEFNRERSSFLKQIESWLETPMLVLGFAWLGLLIYGFIWNLSPALELFGTIIWIIFILDFTLKSLLCARKSNLCLKK